MYFIFNVAGMSIKFDDEDFKIFRDEDIVGILKD